MFRRTSSETPHKPAVEPKPGGKGRPTPTRKEAEAAARDRARLPRDKRALAKRQRELRLESSRKVREAMKGGEEKYLPARDQGPVRRLVRDVIDSRLGFGEILLPMLIVILILGYGAAGTPAATFANSLLYTMMLIALADVLWLRIKVRREVRRRFPEESLKGLTTYAVMRGLNMRFLRLPKPKVKIGQELPDTYR